MPKKKEPDIEKKICDAALKLASTKPWRDITLAQIAKTARLPTAKVTALFSSTDKILPGIVRYFDGRIAKTISRPNPSDSPHDRLFDVMMTRFELLQSQRKAVLGIIDETKKNPHLMKILIAAQWQAMAYMLKIAGLSPTKSQQPFVIAGLLSIYGLTLCIWQRDQSIDIGQTMAALDRYLRYAAKFAAILFHIK